MYDKLNESDLKQLWGDIYYVSKNQAPSGVMFATGVRTNGIKVMAKNGVMEGIDLGMEIIRQQGWGRKSRVMGGFSAMQYYGKSISKFFPELEKVMGGFKDRDLRSLQGSYKKMQSNAATKLKSIKPYIKE